MPFLINIKKYYVVFGMICLLAVLFSSWLASGINYFNLVSSSSDFQSIYSWHPLIKGVSLGNLFPSQPNINISAQAFLFYPYITLWIYGLMVWIVGMKMVVIISTVIFPIVSFYLLYKIFLRQLTEIWSVTISLTCLLAFSDWPFRSFLIGLIKGLPFDKLTTIQPLEIAHYPIPSLSVMVFLLLFYFSTQQKKMTFGRMTLYTSLWGLFSQIHLVDSLFGLAFWFIFFPIQLFKQSKKQLDSLFIKKIFSQILIGLLALLPIIFTWKKLSQYNSFEKIGLIVSGVGNGPDFFYISIYFLLPLFLTFIVFLIKKVDYYEILTRFIHVYVLLLVEFILVISSMFFSSSFEIDVIQNRIALFFLHFYLSGHRFHALLYL